MDDSFEIKELISKLAKDLENLSEKIANNRITYYKKETNIFHYFVNKQKYEKEIISMQRLKEKIEALLNYTKKRISFSVNLSTALHSLFTCLSEKDKSVLEKRYYNLLSKIIDNNKQNLKEIKKGIDENIGNFFNEIQISTVEEFYVKQVNSLNNDNESLELTVKNLVNVSHCNGSSEEFTPDSYHNKLIDYLLEKGLLDNYFVIKNHVRIKKSYIDRKKYCYVNDRINDLLVYCPKAKYEEFADLIKSIQLIYDNNKKSIETLNKYLLKVPEDEIKKKYDDEIKKGHYERQLYEFLLSDNDEKDSKLMDELITLGSELDESEIVYIKNRVFKKYIEVKIIDEPKVELNNDPEVKVIGEPKVELNNDVEELFDYGQIKEDGSLKLTTVLHLLPTLISDKAKKALEKKYYILLSKALKNNKKNIEEVLDHGEKNIDGSLNLTTLLHLLSLFVIDKTKNTLEKSYYTLLSEVLNNNQNADEHIGENINEDEIFVIEEVCANKTNRVNNNKESLESIVKNPVNFLPLDEKDFISNIDCIKYIDYLLAKRLLEDQFVRRNYSEIKKAYIDREKYSFINDRIGYLLKNSCKEKSEAFNGSIKSIQLIYDNNNKALEQLNSYLSKVPEGYIKKEYDDAIQKERETKEYKENLSAYETLFTEYTQLDNYGSSDRYFELKGEINDLESKLDEQETLNIKCNLWAKWQKQEKEKTLSRN